MSTPKGRTLLSEEQLAHGRTLAREATKTAWQTYRDIQAGRIIPVPATDGVNPPHPPPSSPPSPIMTARSSCQPLAVLLTYNDKLKLSK